MAIEDIKISLEKRFCEPLKEFYERRIIFWNDEGKEFSDEIEELSLENAKVLILKENNHFEIKKILNHDDLTSNFLIYNNLQVDMEEDWFLDIKLYSEEFRADQLSMWMQEMNIENIPAIRNKLGQYKSYLKAANRRKQVAQFGSKIDNTTKLHLAILASICRVNSLNVKEIIKSVMNDGMDLDNQIKMDLLHYNASETFWSLVKKACGYDGNNIDEMNISIILSAISKTMNEKALSGLEDRYDIFKASFCYELIYEWLHSDRKDKLVEVLRNCEKQVGLVERFNQLEISDLVDTELLPCIDEIVLNKLMERINNHTINTDEIIAIVEKRRTMVWYVDNQCYYDALLQYAKMEKFYEDNVNAFHHTNAKEMWRAYCDKYYEMDSYYRMFHVGFAQSLNLSNNLLDDKFRLVVDEVERLYKNWYLDKLAENWNRVSESELVNYGEINGINQQDYFYRRYIKNEDRRIFVIISDALRYEVATSIAKQLKSETKADVNIDSQQAIFPTITKFGMAALLPHRKLSLVKKNDTLKVLVDGNSSEASERETILKSYNPLSIAVKYKDLILMKKEQQRELIKGKEVIYIYHDTIDGMSHHDERKVFNACESAQKEIVGLVKMITNSLNGINVIITSDHGFLYTYQALREDDKMARSSFKQAIIEQGRRYVIMDKNAEPDYLMSVKGFYHDDEFECFTPRENMRIKGSGGVNFVHGGASLQELVVPVIKYKFMRSGNKEYENNKDKYDTKAVSIALLSSSNKISNMIFSLSFYQKEAVKDNYVACNYKVFFSDAYGNVISDIQTIVADRSSSNNVDREYRCTFNLKQQNYHKYDIYYLVIQDEAGLQLPIKEEFQIDISMTFDDFDLFS